jgi:hypothetical protein
LFKIFNYLKKCSALQFIFMLRDDIPNSNSTLIFVPPTYTSSSQDVDDIRQT